MGKTRQAQLMQRTERILSTAQALLLDSNTLNLDELSQCLDIAKGTLYKHFSSKDDLLFQLLIRHENQLLQSHQIDDDASARLTRWLMYLLYQPKQTIMFYHLEEQLTDLLLASRFAALYDIRQKRLTLLQDVCQDYLQKHSSTLLTYDYLNKLWTTAYGGALLLNCSFYQGQLGNRNRFVLSLIEEALALPKYHKTPKIPTPTPPKLDDNLSPFGKLTPPTL